jgi:CheY-like chemotaxis protein/DNA-directed RNA polymerase specialized sigma24 family protein
MRLVFMTHEKKVAPAATLGILLRPTCARKSRMQKIQAHLQRDLRDKWMTSDANSILKLLPFVRRYARALTGSQTRGDNYVRLCLETILAEPGRMEGEDAKLQLFKAFHDAWRAVDTQIASSRSSLSERGPQISRGLAALPSLERQVLLLTFLEEFSLEDTASIVGVDKEQARLLLDNARNEVQLVSSVPILIIEDEPMIALELGRIVRDLGHRVCGTAARQSEAIELAARAQPALILADIQLKGRDSGIAAVQEILKNVEVPVIFVTGFPERLLTGDKLEPAFVVPKPFSPEMLKAAIGQALSVVAYDDLSV